MNDIQTLPKTAYELLIQLYLKDKGLTADKISISERIGDNYDKE